MKKDQYPRYVVMLSNFGHDGNGNPIATHKVYGYISTEQPIDEPTDRLYETGRRQQVGAGGNRDDWAGSALRLAGALSPCVLVRTEGSRAEGLMKLIYDVPGFALPKPKHAIGDRVEYTNGYGVYLGIHTITGVEYRTNRPCYHITPTDTPWYAVGEESFKAVNIDKPSSKYVTYGREFKTHAFPDDASANAFMLAYNGWGLIGIDIDDGIERLRHVAKISDKGTKIKK